MTTVKDVALSKGTIKLSSIIANSGQTRGMGVMPQLLALGYGVFEKASLDAEKEAIWPMLVSDKPEDRKHAVALIREHEPDIVDAAESQDTWGQLQDIRVLAVEDGSYDVIYGMTRCLARAFLHASDPKEPDTIDAVVMDGAIKPIDVLSLGFAENHDRRQESPIDMAILFKRIKSEFSLEPPEIGKRFGGQSGQHVRNYIKLLHPKLADKRMAIHEGELPVYKALALLERRLKNDGEDDDTGNGAPSGARVRFPAAKKLEAVYNAKKKPKDVEQKEWEMLIKDDVRKWLAFRLNKKFRPFSGEVLTEEAEPEPDPVETAKEAAKQVLKITIPKGLAIKLLTALGKPESADWEDKTLADKLENVVNIAEEGTKLGDEKLQKLFDKLYSRYKTGVNVTIKAKA